MSSCIASYVSRSQTIFRVILQLLSVCSVSTREYNTTTADWMGNLPSSLHKWHLFDLAIPGSHDSGSYSLRPESYNSFDRDKFSEYFKVAFNDSNKSFIGGIIYNWSKTQNQNITEQLNLGIRYLDLRVTVDLKGECIIVHRLLGANLSEILEQINSFLPLHPKEIILLDFNHVYYDHSVTDFAAKLIMTDLAKKIFKNKICPVSMIYYAKLEDYWSRQCQVLILYGTAKITGRKSNKRHPSGLIVSPFNEKVFTQKTPWLHFLNSNYFRGRPYGRLYVTQGIMEPHWIEIAIAGVSQNATLKTWVSDDASTELVKWLHGKHSGKNGINIVIADFVESHEFVETMLSLNSFAVSCNGDSPLMYFLFIFAAISVTVGF